MSVISIRATVFGLWCIGVMLHGAVPQYSAEIVELKAGSSVSSVSFLRGSGHLLIYDESPAVYVWDGKNAVSTGGTPVLDRSGFGWSSYVCGSWGEGSAYCAVIFANGASYELPRRTAPGNIIFDFNSRGEFVGAEGFGPSFLWRAGNYLELSTLLEGTNSFNAAMVINDDGVIYGWKGAQEKSTLVRLTPNSSDRYRFEELQTFTNSDLHISKNGHVAGRGFVWSESAGLIPFDLGLPGQIRSFSVNSFGEVVGFAWMPRGLGMHGFLHSEATYDLNDIVDLPAGVIITEARDINEYGQIAAIAVKAEGSYAVRLTGSPSLAVAPEAGSMVRLAIRPASETPLRLESSLDLRFWTPIQAWNQPAPIEVVHLKTGAGNRFFRVAR